MVNSGVMVSLYVSIAICIALPVVPFIVLQAKKQHIGRAFLFGVLAFTISQIVLRIPLLQLLASTFWYQTTLGLNPVLNGLFLGLTAGLFEEFARFFACKWFLKKQRRYVDAAAFGFGHGGIEAILLTGLTLVSSIVMINAMNNGTLESLVGAQQAAAFSAQLSGVTPLLALMGGVERILAVGIHFSLSVMIFAGFVRNKPWQYLIAAILLHAVVDAAVVIVPSYVQMSAFGLEAMVFVFTAALLVWALRAKRLFVPVLAQDGEAAGFIKEPDNTEEE